MEFKNFAKCEVRTHDLKIMRLTRCRLRQLRFFNFQENISIEIRKLAKKVRIYDDGLGYLKIS